jgi:hypothetical protein
MNRAVDADPGLHRFRKTNLFYAKDPYLIFQDPTILGFKLMFEFTGDGLLSLDESNPNTALNFLNRVGQGGRAELLKTFIEHLRNINNTTPWFFQEIEGLEDAWKRGFQEKEFIPILPEDRTIKINCLESIDMRITTLMDMYRKACFDWNFRREIVPWNLRLFNISIYVYELRNINRDGIPAATDFIDIRSNIIQRQQNADLLGDDPINTKPRNMSEMVTALKDNLIEYGGGVLSGIKESLGMKSTLMESSNTVNPNISRLLFNLRMCEFKPDESGSIINKVDNKGGDFATQSISFSYRNIEEFNLNTIYGKNVQLNDAIDKILEAAAFDAIATNPNGGNSFGLNGALNPITGIINPLAQLGLSTVEQMAKSFIGKALLGNVYGLQPANLFSSAGNILSGNPADVIGGISDIASQVSNVATHYANKNTGDVDKIGNVYPTKTSSGSNDVDTLGNIFSK